MKRKRILALFLAAVSCLSLAVSASAAGTTTRKATDFKDYDRTAWYADKELTQKITSVKMTRDKTVYAGWEATGVPGMLNGDDHYAYVVG